jgi:hypothetical protein
MDNVSFCVVDEMSNWQNVLLTKWQVCKNGQATNVLLGQGALQFANFIIS